MSLPRTSYPTSNHLTGLNTDVAGRRDYLPLVRAASAASVSAVVILAQLGLVLAPSQLGRHPLLVLALRPTPAFLVLLSDLVASTTAILLASVSRTLVDMAYFAVARYGALPIAQRFGIGRDLARGVSRRTATRGLLTLTFFWSSTPVIAAIGLGRTPILKFLAITGIGNIATSSVFVFSGHRFSEYTAPVTSWVSAHGTQLTVALAFAVGLSFLAALRRNTRTNPDSSPV